MKKEQVFTFLTLAGLTLAFVVLGDLIQAQFYAKMIFPVNGRLSSKFGNRIHPIHGTNKFHNGIDIAAPTGTPIVAPANGTVEKTWNDSLNGNAITIKHANGYTTGYAHLSKIDVTPGQKVKQGEKIGEVGNTGASTGAHLHLTVRDPQGKVIDPLGVLV